MNVNFEPIIRGLGNNFFSLPKCKVVFVRWYLTYKVVTYKKNCLKMSAYIKSHVGLHLTCKVVPYKK